MTQAGEASDSLSGGEGVGASAYADLDQAIASFAVDPPDSDYQRGYLAALVEVRASMPPDRLRPALEAIRAGYPTNSNAHRIASQALTEGQRS